MRTGATCDARLVIAAVLPLDRAVVVCMPLLSSVLAMGDGRRPLARMLYSLPHRRLRSFACVRLRDGRTDRPSLFPFSHDDYDGVLYN